MDSARQLKRNQHRVLAAYLSMYCWLEGVDALIVPRGFFEKTLGLERFRDTRLDEIKSDFERFFAERTNLVYSGKAKFATLIIAREKIEDIGPTMSDAERATYLSNKGIKTKVISDQQSYKDLNFDQIAAKMMAISAGLVPPSDIPKLKIS